ncbi:MAG: tetratricopeptide repeat protein [Candidatus Scalindua sp.]|jgi:tetratricopeptide (TPR) repeat protein|nr:tetratricopeptide repeat protein [Candidatus Scalindua sp.]MBT6228295.1 tetratricopeptide repeat protein [Candidatus Scalindua sp.]MBT7590034.1 tetratricopeptide repeat protein [Candidatus Scalindua sp.]
MRKGRMKSKPKHINEKLLMKDNNATNFLNKKYFYMICLFLVIATLAVYWQVLNNDFVIYDDDKYVTENTHVHKGVTFDSLTWAFTSSHASNWHPLTWISHMIDYQLYGLNARGHHLTSLLFHVANTLLLFLILVRMTGTLWQSSFVAALFALHPLHVESVAWVAERKDVLSTFFMMLTVWAYILYVKKREIKGYLLVVLFFVLGLMSKPMLVTLPFILLLLDFWPLGRLCLLRDTKNVATGQHTNERADIFRLVLEKAPFFALAVGSSIVTFIVQERGGAMEIAKTYSIQTRIINAFVAYTEYIVDMIWPVKLALLYPHPGNSLQLWKGVVAGFALVLITILVIRKARRIPYLAVGWLWYIVTLIPVIGIVQVGSQAMADRYTYVTLIGLFIIIAWGANDLLSKWRHRKIWLSTLAAIILPVLIVLTWKQVQYWENGITLFKHTLRHTSNNYVIHNNLGIVLREQGRTEEAIKHYLQALRSNPDYALAHYNLSNAYAEQGKNKKVIEACKHAIRIKPDYADAHYNLGVAYGGSGKYEEAVEAFKQVIRIDSNYLQAHYNLGGVYAGLGKYRDAIEAFQQVIRIDPDYALVRNNLGIAYGALGRYKEAAEAFQQAIRIDPDDADAHLSLGIAYLSLNDRGSALEQYKILKSLDPKLAKRLFSVIKRN